MKLNSFVVFVSIFWGIFSQGCELREIVIEMPSTTSHEKVVKNTSSSSIKRAFSQIFMIYDRCKRIRLNRSSGDLQKKCDIQVVTTQYCLDSSLKFSTYLNGNIRVEPYAATLEEQEYYKFYFDTHVELKK